MTRVSKEGKEASRGRQSKKCKMSNNSDRKVTSLTAHLDSDLDLDPGRILGSLVHCARPLSRAGDGDLERPASTLAYRSRSRLSARCCAMAARAVAASWL